MLMDNQQPSQAGQPAVSTANQATASKNAAAAKPKSSIGKTIAIILLSLSTATFIGLFIWRTITYNEVKTDVDLQIETAVAEAKDLQAEQLEAEFAEREKYPYTPFSGPVDYGELSFEYPKTWSVYIESDASKGGDFKAYLNPGGVNVASEKTLNALRVSILDQSYETVVATYDSKLKGKNPTLTVETVVFNNITANRYTGTIPGTNFNGVIVVFKVRDKAVVLRTDSMNFVNDFDNVLKTVTINA